MTEQKPRLSGLLSVPKGQANAAGGAPQRSAAVPPSPPPEPPQPAPPSDGPPSAKFPQLSFRVPPGFNRDFRQMALNHDLSLTDLLVIAFRHLQNHPDAASIVEQLRDQVEREQGG